MGNSQHAFQQLTSVDLNRYHSYSQPLCITQNNSQCIFIMPTFTKKWLKFDVESNQFMNPQKYPAIKYQLTAHASAIDAKNKRIYIVNGSHSLLMILDTKKADDSWSFYENFSMKCGPFPTICYIPAPFNELHVITMGKHLKWGQNEYNFVQLSNLKHKQQHSALIYVRSKQQLFLMGGMQTGNDCKYSNSIYVANYIHSRWKWTRLTEIQLPHKMAKFGHIVYQSHYIILFGGEIAEKNLLDNIYVLNVDNYEWISVDQKCPEKNAFFAVQNQDKVHLFQRGDNQQHKQWVIDVNKLTLKQKRLTEQEEIKEPLNESVENPENGKSTDTTRLVNAIQIQQMQNEITKLQSQLKDVQNELKTEKNKSEQYVEKMHRQIRNLSVENERLTLQNMTEKLKQENRNLRRKWVQCLLYDEWDSQDIMFWILSLEQGKFLKYEELLTKKLMDPESKTNGTHLSQVQHEYTVMLWGIKDIEDQKCLLKHIKSLCQNKFKFVDECVCSNNVEGVNLLITDQ